MFLQIDNIPQDEAKGKILSRNARRVNQPKAGGTFSIAEENSSKFSLFEDGDSSGSCAAPKFEFEKQMLLQLELRESLDRGTQYRSKHVQAASFAGLSEAVLAEETPKPSVSSKTRSRGANPRSGGGLLRSTAHKSSSFLRPQIISGMRSKGIPCLQVDISGSVNQAKGGS